jgi:hypothetical protein
MQPLFTRKLFLEVYIPLGIAFYPFALALEFLVGFKGTDVGITYGIAVIIAVFSRILWLKVRLKDAA